jgi:hypothetical protein
MYIYYYYIATLLTWLNPHPVVCYDCILDLDCEWMNETWLKPVVMAVLGQLSIPSSTVKLNPWWWDIYVAPKCWLLITNLHCITSQTSEDLNPL